MESWDEKKFSLKARTLSITFCSTSGIRLEDNDFVLCKKSFFSQQEKTAHIPTSIFIPRVCSKLILIPLYAYTGVYMKSTLHCAFVLYS